MKKNILLIFLSQGVFFGTDLNSIQSPNRSSSIQMERSLTTIPPDLHSPCQKAKKRNPCFSAMTDAISPKSTKRDKCISSVLTNPKGNPPNENSFNLSKCGVLPEKGILNKKQLNNEINMKIKEYKPLFSSIRYISGEKPTFKNGYLDEYKACYIIDALEEAKQNQSEVVCIKERIIDTVLPKILVEFGSNQDIIGATIVKNSFVPIIKQLVKFELELRDLNEHRGIGYSDKKEKLIQNIQNQIELLEEVANSSPNAGNTPESSNVDSLDESLARRVVDSLVILLEPYVRFGKDGMPAGSYLSVDLAEAIIDVMKQYCNPEDDDNYIVGFPFWFQKLIQTTTADGTIKISPRNYYLRYYNDLNKPKKHPLLSIRKEIASKEVYLYYQDNNQIEKNAMKLAENFIFTQNSMVDSILALSFRAILLNRDIKEFDSELRKLSHDDKEFEFISNMKERHIKQFEEQIKKNNLFMNVLMNIFPRLRRLFKNKFQYQKKLSLFA